MLNLEENERILDCLDKEIGLCVIKTHQSYLALLEAHAVLPASFPALSLILRMGTSPLLAV
jgi:hypothetical protein